MEWNDSRLDEVQQARRRAVGCRRWSLRRVPSAKPGGRGRWRLCWGSARGVGARLSLPLGFPGDVRMRVRMRVRVRGRVRVCVNVCSLRERGTTRRPPTSDARPPPPRRATRPRHRSREARRSPSISPLSRALARTRALARVARSLARARGVAAVATRRRIRRFITNILPLIK